MTGNEIVPGQGAISKNPPSEFTIEELADWLARLNVEFGYSRDKQYFRKIIEDAINTGDLTIGGSPKYPLPGRCVDCHRSYLAPQTIQITDVEQWCIKKGFVFGGVVSQKQETNQTSNEKTVKKHSRKALLSVIKGMYQDINETFIPLIDKYQLPYHLQEKIKKDCKLRPSGYGEYLTNNRGACKSADDIVPEALNLKPEKK